MKLHDVPSERRCQATSKRSGRQCKQYRMPDSEFCIVHSGKLTAAAAEARSQARVDRLIEKARVESPTDPDVFEPTHPPTEQERQWELMAELRKEAAAKREQDFHPPELTPVMIEKGLLWRRRYLAPNLAPGGGFRWILNEDSTRYFRWEVTSREEEMATGNPSDGGLDEIRLRAEEWAAHRRTVRRMRELGVDPRRIQNYMETGSIHGGVDRRPTKVVDYRDVFKRMNDGLPAHPAESDEQPVPLADLTIDGHRMPELWR